MEETNFSMLMYFLEPRSPAEVKALMEHVLGCQLAVEDADVPLEEREGCFEGEVFGLYVSLQLARQWPEGNVYRLSGSTKQGLYVPGGKKISLDSHMIRLLRHHGLQDVMTVEEFGKKDRERFPAFYAKPKSASED